MNREDIAWAAGLFEGEGTFVLTRYSNRLSPHAAMQMTDEDVVRRFAAVVGLGTISVRPPRKPGYKQAWLWQTTSLETVQAVGAMFWPWLGSRRKQRWTEIMHELRLAGTATRRRTDGRCWQMFGKRVKELTPTERYQYKRSFLDAKRVTVNG